MAIKLAREKYPASHNSDDFKCFGPAANKDGEFKNTMICDMGCFKQDGTDSNKMYHAAIVQSNIDNKWYCYFEWGRTGAIKPSFQFIECATKEEAEEQYCKQLHAKNDKRGRWIDSPLGKILQAKPGKDCYLVRPQAIRSTGLPDAKNITQNDNKKQVKKTKKKNSNLDQQSLQLLQDLNVGTVNYAKKNMVGASLPTQSAIDEARDILKHAMARTKKLPIVIDQINDKELKSYTTLLYSRIPKIKDLKARPETWALTNNNILLWQQDLDAFESALKGDASEAINEIDFYLEHLSLKNSNGEFIYKWMPNATKNRHSYLGSLKIKNIWKINNPKIENNFNKYQESIIKSNITINERIKDQPQRNDLDNLKIKKYYESGTYLMFHGTRSVNVSGILEKSFLLPNQLSGVMITGAMFGGGHYWATDWKKSAGYTSLNNSYWSNGTGKIKNRGAFMFLVDVCLGNPYIAPRPYGYTSPPQGYNSVFGKAGHSGVQNDEFITYSINANNMKYLVEFDI